MTAVLSMGPDRKVRRRAPHSRGRVIAESVTLAALLVFAAGLVELRHYSLPAPTGSFAVGTETLDLTDRARHEDHLADPAARRHVVVQLWYPTTSSEGRFVTYQRWREARLATWWAALLGTHARRGVPVAPGPHALLLFNPRWGGERTQNTALLEDLASHGYVVAGIDHPFNASRVLVNGKVVRGVEALEGPGGPDAPAAARIAYWNGTLDVWAADDRFVLDDLLRRNASAGGPLDGRLDPTAIGALGHSFGGAAALRLLGLDPRVKAAVNLDGWTFGALQNRTAAEPIMILYEGGSEARRSQLLRQTGPGSVEDQLDRADNAAVDASVERYGGEIGYVRDAQHLDFSDQPLLPPLRRDGFTGPIAPGEIHNILRTLVLHFFDHALRGRAETPGDAIQFPEVTMAASGSR